MMSKIIILLVSTFILPSANCNTCASLPNGVHRFGPNCGFMCHCKNNEMCDVISGECSSGCASMWYGPGCQYRDMAEGEFSRHSDNLFWPYTKYSYLANDGNTSTCSYTAEVYSKEKKTNPFWRVWLPTQETIRELMIVTRVETLENFKSFAVYVENISKDDYGLPTDRQECYKHNNVAPENETIIILCKTPVAGNQVRIELATLHTQLVLCDVRINGGRNLAFGREAFQSSTDIPCKEKKPDGCTAIKAVDGNDSQSIWQECSYTSGEQNSWWKLDIGHQTQIWYARIYPLRKVNIDYLSKLRLDVSNTTDGKWKTVKDEYDQLKVNNSLNTVARYVKLTNPENQRRIKICEIKIFGDCQNGFCGYDCRKECNCRKTNIWDTISGTCNSAGKDNHWDQRFEHKCGHCLNADLCDVSTGECPAGCQEGYIPPKCNKALRLTDNSGGFILGIAAALTIFFGISVATIFAIFYMRTKRRQRTVKRRDDVELTESDAEYVNATATTSHQVDNCSTNRKSNESKTYNDYAYAVVSKQSDSAIPISALAEHVIANSDRILEEFQKLPHGMQYPSLVGVKPCNRGKNRYRDMFAYDHSRVVLEKLTGVEGSDYINACFIRGFLKDQAYIAAQGPFETTIDDFWRMIWETDVTTIAMLTNFVEETKAKCQRYWPMVESSTQYGDFIVRTDSEMIFAEFTIRDFFVSCGREPPRIIRQFHYTAWPDKSVPGSASSLLHFWRKVRSNDVSKSHPWLVHCSAGVGRTGTFIATDILYDQAKTKGYVDIYQCVGDLREQRVNMVQTKGQYNFLYGLMAEAFVMTPEPVPLKSFDQMVKQLNELGRSTSKTKLVQEYETLNENSPYIPSDDNSEDKYLAARLPENKNKNRCSAILPPNEFRPFLLTKLPNCTDYINAVYMPSYCEMNCYILTQLPMKTTAIDCCRLVYEEDVKVIVTFGEKVKQELGTYLPENGLIKLGPFAVLKKSEEDKEIYKKKTFNLCYGSEDREIIQLEFKAWSSSCLVPSVPLVMIKFIQEVEYYKRVAENKPVIVQCLNGSEKCGLFVALVNVLERARFDNEVSIPQCIRQLRVRREEIIPNFEQFKFCYDVLLCHIENDSMYANM